MILLIDNYDSFTYNIVEYLGQLGCQVKVVRNDAITPAQLAKVKPSRVVISPGPGTPDDAGVSCDAIRHFSGRGIPVLGVCLGHQSIGQVFGGKVVLAGRQMHGKISDIYHDNAGLFKGLPMPFKATRYHSLIVRRKGLPKCLEVTAWTKEDEIMGLRHRELPVYGVQFHPESIMTQAGMDILKNFLRVKA